MSAWSEQVMLPFPCHYCHAPAGHRCESRSGHGTTYAHSSRFYQATAAGIFPRREGRHRRTA